MCSAYNTSAGSAEPLTSQPNETMKGGLQGELDLKTSGPESEKWETPIGKERDNWEKTPSRTAGLPDWPGMSDRSRGLSVAAAPLQISAVHDAATQPRD